MCKYGEGILILGKLAFRMKSNVRNMLLITVVLTLSLCGFSLIPILAEFSNEYMEQRMVFDVNIPFNYDKIEEQNDIPDIDYSFVHDIFEKNHIAIRSECVLEEYFIWDDDFTGPSMRKNKYDMPRLAIGISDYNQLRKMAGLEKAALEEGSFLYHVKNDVDIGEYKEALDRHHTISVGGCTMKSAENNFIMADNLGSYIYNTNTDDLLVFPDEVCSKLKLAKKSYFANLDGAVAYRQCKDAESQIYSTFKENYSYLYEKYAQSSASAIDFMAPIRFINIEKNDISFMVIITKSLGIYIGIIFMSICMAMVSIKNIVECGTDIHNYQYLHQIGMSWQKIKRLNLKENLFFYLVPYFVSIVNFYIVQKTFFMRFGKRIDVYFEGNGYVNGMVIPLLAVSIILFVYVFVSQIINYHKIDSISGERNDDRIPTAPIFNSLHFTKK